MKSDAPVFQLVAHCSGRVQGVGFRYTTLQVAKGFEVTGYVKNLPDGRVELVAEGREEECREFLAAVQEEQSAYIRQTETREGRVETQRPDFRIA